MVALCALGIGFVEARRISDVADDNIYADEIILARDTPYQHIVLTRFKDDIRLFLSSHLSSARATNTATTRRSCTRAVRRAGAATVLVLGGDGLAVRGISNTRKSSASRSWIPIRK